jgi:hypothetical protein
MYIKISFFEDGCGWDEEKHPKNKQLKLNEL